MNQISRTESPFWTRANRHLLHFGCDFAAFVPALPKVMLLLLGVAGDLGRSLGLDNRWALEIVKQVGNYGAIYDRAIAPHGLVRGPNALTTTGGFQFAPLMR